MAAPIRCPMCGSQEQWKKVDTQKKSDLDYKIYSSVLTITFICATILLNIISSEYEALFSDKHNELNDWKIVSVSEFENY